MSKCECKECVHEKVCKTREFPSLEEILKDGCPHYKDKSLFVELPCKVGDTVYIISDYTNEILDRLIIGLTIKKDGYGFIFDTQSSWSDTDIGKTVFLTKEEAERILKNAENN